jgi:competence protein ComEA
MSWYECPKCGRELTSEQACEGRCKRCGDVCVRIRGKNPTGPLDLNKATALELQRIVGLGEKSARYVVLYRGNHKFTEVSQLLKIRGIGKKMFEKIKENVTV